MSGDNSLLLKGGRVITASDDYVADVLVRDGRISMVGTSIESDSARALDCTGKYILPGCVDPHTHMDTPVTNARTCDDFTSGTTAAAFGGTTTIVDFCQQTRDQSVRDALEGWHRKLQDRPPLVDVGFHLALSDVERDDALTQLGALPDDGVTSYKVFMAYKKAVMLDDEALFQVMLTARESGALLMLHAENGGAIAVLVRSAVEQGHREPIWHARTRPARLEGEATARAIQLAQVADCPVYFVHVSCIEAIEAIAGARQAGMKVWGETCPHYLLIDESVLDQPREEASKYVYTPPPRSREDQEALWAALSNGALSVVATDHGPFMLSDKLAADSFNFIPNGAIGVEQRLVLLHEFGVRSGRISLNKMVDLLSTQPARLFGLYPRKGTIAPGSDADLVVFDPSVSVEISAESHHSRVDYNLYEGMQVTGAPETVIVRGQIVVENSKLVGRPGDGQFIHRARFGDNLAVWPTEPEIRA